MIKRLQHKYFPVSITKFLKTLILKKSSNSCFCMNKLHTKHPATSPMYDDLLGSTVLVDEVIYDSIDESEILRACLRPKDAAGVSGF